MKSYTSSRILRTIFCTLLPAALMVFSLSSCKEKKSKVVDKKKGYGLEEPNIKEPATEKATTE